MLTKYHVCFILTGALAIGCTGSRNEIPVKDPVSDSTIIATGYVYLENQDIRIISAPCDGKIASVKAAEGQRVNAGNTLATIENSDILNLQKEYLEAGNELEFRSREYARQGDLTVENATSLKRMEVAKHDYQAADLKYQSARKQLILLGINPDSVKPGNLRARLSILSPVKGIITSFLTAHGGFVRKGDPLFEIAGSQSLLLTLEIPETYCWKVKKDQPVSFHIISDSTMVMEAQIIHTAQSVDRIKHTAEIKAMPSSASGRLLPGMSVKAVIHINGSKQ